MRPSLDHMTSPLDTGAGQGASRRQCRLFLADRWGSDPLSHSAPRTAPTTGPECVFGEEPGDPQPVIIEGPA